MRLETTLRALLVLLLVLAVFAIIAVVLFVSETAFAVWDRLMSAPIWLRVLYAGVFTAAGALLAWAILVILGPRRKAGAAVARRPRSDPARRMAEAEAAGMDVQDARRELAELGRRKATGEIYIALLGQVSTGKSSMIRALVPGADPEVSAVGGSTRQVTAYQWQGPGGSLHLSDLPGLHLPDGRDDESAMQEARRAHVVVFLAEGDLTRAEWRALSQLLALGRPLVLAVNKSDRYDPHSLQQVLDRLAQRLAQMAGEGQGVRVVATISGGTEQVLREYADGRSESVPRPRPAQLDALRQAIDELLRQDPTLLEAMRDESVFALVGEKLDRAQAVFRRQQADQVVGAYTRKAVLGALAAVSPGTDLVIQGYLATQMVRELCQLYEVPARKLDVQAFLDLSQGYVTRTVPLLLAVAGNGLKAFPGLGTVAGGLMHAVAYGLIFDALGCSLAHTLEASGELQPAPAAERFREQLSEDLETRARELAKLALGAGQQQQP